MSSAFSMHVNSTSEPSDCLRMSSVTLSISSMTRKAFLTGTATLVRLRYDSTNLISPREDCEMVSSPLRIVSSSSGLSCVYFMSVSLREAIGVTVFMISCVRTRMSLVHDSCSFSAMSLLMSLNATTLTSWPEIVAADAVKAMVLRPLSL